MEFDEMKKIWDAQSNKTMYAIDEEALHQRVINKKLKAARWVNKMELILMTSLLFASTVIWSAVIYKSKYEIPQLALGSLMVLGAIAILIGRRKRLSWQHAFENTMLGDIDQAIANASYQVKLSQSGKWAYLVISIFAVLSVFNNGSEWWKGALVLVFFIFGYFAARWEHKTFYVAQKRGLLAMREKLIQLQDDGNSNQTI